MGERLKLLRIEKGLTQKQVAEIIGLTVKGYNFYELNLREPPIDTLKKLCNLFNVSSDYLLGLEDETGAKVYNNTVNDNHGHITFNQK